jgi:hypothetical protein
MWPLAVLTALGRRNLAGISGRANLCAGLIVACRRWSMGLRDAEAGRPWPGSQPEERWRWKSFSWEHFFLLDLICAPRALRIYYRNREVPNNLGADGCWTRLAFQRLPISDRPQAPSGLKRDLLDRYRCRSWPSQGRPPAWMKTIKRRGRPPGSKNKPKDESV